MSEVTAIFPHNLQGYGRIWLPLLAGPCHVESKNVLDTMSELIPNGGVFLEIGTWTGCSACYIADKRRDATIITVDSKESVTRAVLTIVNVFLRPNVRLLYGGIQNISKFLRDKCIDVIFVDGQHEYSAVLRDLSISDRLITDDGYICCHDYDKQHDNVLCAVNKFVSENYYEVIKTVKSLAILKKG